jgi:hypothetical protein
VVWFGLDQGPGAPLGPPADRAGHVQQGRRPGTTRQDEGVEFAQTRVELVAPPLKPGDVRLRYPQWRIFRIRGDRCAQISTHVKEVVLYASQDLDDLRRSLAEGEDDADRGVGLIHVGVRLDARVGFRDPGAVTERGRAGVAGLRVDAGEVNGHAS